MIFKRLEPQDIVPASQTVVTTGMWSGDKGGLKSGSGFLYNQQVAKSAEYYIDVYDENPNTNEVGSSDTAEIQFAITYGHINGGGSPTLFDEETTKEPTKAIYSQYRNLLLGQTDVKFKFNNVESDHIYVINVQRSRIRQQLDPGNWQLPLSGANGAFTFIDDSKDTLEALSQTTAAGRVYNIISGSINTLGGVVTGSATYNSKGFGLVYPDLGIIVLNPEAICPLVGFYTTGSTTTFSSFGNTTGSAYSGSTPIYSITGVQTLDNSAVVVTSVPFAPFTGSYSGWGSEKGAYNHAGLFTSIKKAITRNDTLFEFRARSRETISSTHYFVRLRNNEFNYSNNPTFKNQGDNTIIIPQFKSDPKVYITTVGLYNDNNELLAVAKLSKPVRKSFAEELLLRIRLDF